LQLGTAKEIVANEQRIICSYASYLIGATEMRRDMTTEQRNSYRCPNVDEAQKAVIKIGHREIVVDLTNQSAGGFSVVAKGKLRVREGDVLFVRTSAGWFQAQVVYRNTVSGKTTLGLNRVADLPDPRDSQLVKPGGRKYEAVGSGSTSAGSLLMFTIVAGLAFWGFMLNSAWFRGPGAANGMRVNLGSYLSRVVDHVTPNWGEDSAPRVEAPTETTSIE